MASRLTPCPACTRHVKVGSAACPFCGGDVPVDVPVRAMPASRPLTRAAIMLAGAAAASGCSSSSGGQPLPPYGVMIVPDSGSPDAGTKDAGTKDADDDLGQPATHYGVFIDPDAGSGQGQGPR